MSRVIDESGVKERFIEGIKLDCNTCHWKGENGDIEICKACYEYFFGKEDNYINEATENKKIKLLEFMIDSYSEKKK